MLKVVFCALLLCRQEDARECERRYHNIQAEGTRLHEVTRAKNVPFAGCARGCMLFELIESCNLLYLSDLLSLLTRA